MEKLIEISSSPVKDVLELLLKDQSTNRNIIWASDTYEGFGKKFAPHEEISLLSLFTLPTLIRPRIQKTQEEQDQRTKNKAEVFTPAWLCNRMNNACDEDWFGTKNVFNIETSNHSWIVREEKIIFPKERSWATYVDSKRLEITCGEAPFLASRYDTSTGELLIPPLKRIGLLDRKLRIVNENTKNYEDWIQWTFRAFESCYGYEYQGDNVLIARINLFLTFVDYYIERWKKHPSKELLEQIAIKIVWNIWQMDGLKKIPPCCQTNEDSELLPLFDELELESLKGKKENVSQCNIFDWRSNSSLVFRNLGEESSMKKKLFDYVIGNPPYQEGQIPGNGENSLKNFAPPVYDKFMEGAYQVSNKVILIHPARFLLTQGPLQNLGTKKCSRTSTSKLCTMKKMGTRSSPPFPPLSKEELRSPTTTRQKFLVQS